jgi:hypothetical protein
MARSRSSARAADGGGVLDRQPVEPVPAHRDRGETRRADGFPVRQGQLQRWQNGRSVPFGPLFGSKRN